MINKLNSKVKIVLHKNPFQENEDRTTEKCVI